MNYIVSIFKLTQFIHVLLYFSDILRHCVSTYRIPNSNKKISSKYIYTHIKFITNTSARIIMFHYFIIRNLEIIFGSP